MLTANTITLLLLTGSVSAISIPFRRENAPHSTTVNFVSKSSKADGFNFKQKNQGDNNDIYVGTILVSNNPFEVQLDTGSSDLWLDTKGLDLKDFTNTGLTGSITYGDHTVAQGPIVLTSVSFGDFSVANQALISAPGTNATSNGDKGLLGVGAPPLSVINTILSNTSYDGQSFLDNVFSIHPSDPNFITFALSRSTMGVTDGGVFTIAEIASEFSEIDNATPLQVDVASNRWVTTLDAVIVNGQRLTGHGLKGDANGLSALLDTGTSLAQAPPFFVDAMYASIPGSQQQNGQYEVPCDAKIDISFVFAGATFPVHPIDATFPVKDDNGNVVCIGAFSYSDPNEGLDFILGDSFLRNVYSLYDFGSWTSVADSAPFMRLLSVTDAAKADEEFAAMNEARLDLMKAQA